MDDCRYFLLERGAASAGHAQGSLLQHLEGTHALLLGWGCAPHVCRSGLFHSIYGTSLYLHQSVEPHEREVVRRLIGWRSERLAYLFCAADRPQAWTRALASHCLANRSTGSRHCIDAATLTELLEIECANLLDQSTGCGFFRQALEWQAASRLSLRPCIVTALHSHLGTAGQTQ